MIKFLLKLKECSNLYKLHRKRSSWDQKINWIEVQMAHKVLISSLILIFLWQYLMGSVLYVELWIQKMIFLSMCNATVRSLLAANFQLFEEILSPQLLLLLLMMKIDHHFPPISFNHMFVSPLSLQNLSREHLVSFYCTVVRLCDN